MSKFRQILYSKIYLTYKANLFASHGNRAFAISIDNKLTIPNIGKAKNVKKKLKY